MVIRNSIAKNSIKIIVMLHFAVCQRLRCPFFWYFSSNYINSNAVRSKLSRYKSDITISETMKKSSRAMRDMTFIFRADELAYVRTVRPKYIMT